MVGVLFDAKDTFPFFQFSISIQSCVKSKNVKNYNKFINICISFKIRETVYSWLPQGTGFQFWRKWCEHTVDIMAVSLSCLNNRIKKK